MILTKTESALLSFATGLIMLALYQLWLPINYHQANQTILGELDYLENSAKLKMSGDLVWRDAQKGDPVSQGASVFTGENARALVSMNSGNEIQLGANTLIRIHEKVELENGLVSTKLGPEALKVNISGVDYNLEGEGAQLQLSQTDQSTILSVVEGIVKVQGKEESFEIKKDEGLEISEKASQKVVYQIPLLSPKAGEVLWTRQDAEVEFAWSSDGVLIEISRDLIFKEIVLSQTINSSTFSTKLSEGQYYWRVSSREGKSRLGHFSVLKETPIVGALPKNSSVLEIPTEREMIEQRFQWSDTKLKGYEVELEYNQDIRKLNAPQNDLIIPLKDPGSYRWRVLPQDSSRPEALQSEWQSFELIKIQKLASPQWSNDYLEISKASTDESPDVTFTALGIEHEWVIRLGEQTIETQRTTQKVLSFPGSLETGEYNWRVRTFNRFGEASEWSKPLVVKWKPFQERAPIEGQEIQLDRPDQLVNFEWEGAGEHYFELSSDEAFTQVIISRKAQSKTEIVFPEVGTYYWRVRKADGTYSAPKKVKVEPSPPLKAPEAPPELQKELKLEFPKTQKSSSWFDLIIPRAHASELKGRLTINLPENEKADGYKLEVYADEELSKLIYTKISASAEVEWDGAVAGEFWYRYALIDAWGRESEMSPASVLKIVPGQISPPGRAKLIRPIRAQVIKATPSISFSWTTSERSQQYFFQLAKDSEFEMTLFEQLTNNNQIMLETKDLELGEMYYWRVISKHSYGETPSSVGRFVYDVKSKVEEKKIDEKIAKSKRPQDIYSYALLSWKPQKISMKVDEKEFNAQIDGNLLNSLQLESRYYLSKKWGVEASVESQSGKVFSSQDFIYRSLHLGGVYSKASEKSLYHFGLGLIQVSYQSFRLLSPESVASQSESSIAFKTMIEWEYRYHPENSIHTRFSAIAGDVAQLELNLGFRRFVRENIFMQLGFDYAQQEIKTKTGKNKSSLMGLSMSAGLSF